MDTTVTLTSTGNISGAFTVTELMLGSTITEDITDQTTLLFLVLLNF